MFKKLILFILALFFATLVTLADDSSIIPVLWLFKYIESANTIEEFKSVNTEVFPIKTFVLKGNTVEEFKSVNTEVFPIKTFVLKGNTVEEFKSVNTEVFPIKTFVLN